MKKAAGILLVVGIILCCLQVLLPSYFLTGDGPCHVYNARILHDLWINKNVSFWDKFYMLNNKPDPNWATHIILALLQFVVSGVWAEKILLVLYIIFFAWGFYRLLKKLNPEMRLWPVAVFVFVFHHLLAKGFYNFSFSIAFFSWWIWAWLEYMDKKNVRTLGRFFLFAALAFFTHALAFVYGCVTCAALLCSYALAVPAGDTLKARLASFMKTTGVLLLVLTPFIFLFLRFTQQHSGIAQIDLHRDIQRYHDLYDFRSLVNLTGGEEKYAGYVAYLLIGLFLLSLIIRCVKNFRIHKYDGFIVTLLFGLCIYLFFPDALLGGGMLVARAQLLVFVIMFCCIGYLSVYPLIADIGAVLLFICFVTMSGVRYRAVSAASDGVADYVSPVKNIRPYAVVLPMSFSHNGRDGRGKLIADRNWIFCHAAQYIGAEKPLIVLDNYEANTGYFPVIWKNGEINPYIHLCKEEGFEAQPPYAAIEDYRAESGITVDYVITWCYDSTYLSQGHVRQLMQELSDHYHITYTSPSKRTVLYERNR